MTVPLVVAASVVLFALRMFAATRLGFGDAEALYASYALHPQPAYLDHPGLVGVIARFLGGGDAPTPLAAHVGTAFASTAGPWLAAATARAAGASWSNAAIAAAALMLAPEISVGLFGLTPDLLLFLLWYAAVGLAIVALRSEAGSTRALVAALGSGFAAGLACDAKVSGVLLVAGLAYAWAAPAARSHRATFAPWASLVVALVVFAPVVAYEVERGFPMVRHRLVDTQAGAGPSLRNLAALVGGQVLYVTPPLLWAAVVVGRDLHRHRRDDVVSSLLWSVTVAGLPLIVLACVSRVAEPHWVAPIYLALPIHYALRRGDPDTTLVSPRVARAAVGFGGFAVMLAHAWVLTPLAPRLLGRAYVPRYDLANDLYAWETGLPLVGRAIRQSLALDAPPLVIVGSHWTVCAQVQAGLPSSVFVGCEGDIPDDFSRWLPRATWERAPVLLYVTDDRFGDAPVLPGRHADAIWEANVLRGGRVVRRISVTRLAASASARMDDVKPTRARQ